MQVDELTREGAHLLTVCNACRYCEQYCPVFPAMELRRTFTKADLNYLANLCHNCGECLYACQYAPPHEFGINVPRTLTTIRLRSYEEYAWPRALGAAFRHQSVLTGLLLAVAMILVMLTATVAVRGAAVWTTGDRADFYAVMPHAVMVGLFGAVGLFVLVALMIAARRGWKDMACAPAMSAAGRAGAMSVFRRTAAGLRDAVTLRHLHATGEDCVSAEETRSPWRRWCHHSTSYGFMLCFASTTVAAAYHSLLGWRAPYPYTSLPVVLGTLGGIGLLVGPAGLWLLGRRRDVALTDPSRRAFDNSFLVLLFLTSLTGLVLLVLRHGPAMGVLLIVHLGLVLALFLTLPYGKFVHGLHRTVALIKNAGER